MRRRKVWLVPGTFAAMVAVLGLLLLVIGARSPYTHANLVPGFALGYTRTQETAVGTPTPYSPPGLGNPGAAPSNPIQLGQELIVGLNCASCHGLRGQGGTFAPPIAGFDAETLFTWAHQGPGGMPMFANVTQAQLDAVAAYLQSVVKANSSSGSK